MSPVYTDKSATIDALKEINRRVIADISPQLLQKVVENWASRLIFYTYMIKVFFFNFALIPHCGKAIPRSVVMFHSTYFLQGTYRLLHVCVRTMLSTPFRTCWSAQSGCWKDIQMLTLPQPLTSEFHTCNSILGNHFCFQIHFRFSDTSISDEMLYIHMNRYTRLGC